jgi:hypothetical protein
VNVLARPTDCPIEEIYRHFTGLNRPLIRIHAKLNKSGDVPVQLGSLILNADDQGLAVRPDAPQLARSIRDFAQPRAQIVTYGRQQRRSDAITLANSSKMPRFVFQSRSFRRECNLVQQNFEEQRLLQAHRTTAICERQTDCGVGSRTGAEAVELPSRRADVRRPTTIGIFALKT